MRCLLTRSCHNNTPTTFPCVVRSMRCTGIPCRSFHAVTVPPPRSPHRCPWVYRRTSGTLGWHATCLIHMPYDAAYQDRVSITVGWMAGCNQRKRVHSSAFCWPPLATGTVGCVLVPHIETQCFAGQAYRSYSFFVSCSLIHTHTHTHTRAYMLTHTHTHTHTDTLTHSYTRTHTHARTPHALFRLR